jgi:hypothetical protein
MKEIIELNKQLLRDNGKEMPPEGLLLSRRDVPEELEKLSARPRGKIEDLRRRLDETLPDDFDYWLSLGDAKPGFRLNYYNGCISCGGGGHHWQEAVSIFDQLRALNWDEERKFVIRGTETFDAIAVAAKDLPVMLPRTRALQKPFAGPVKAFIKEKRRGALKVYALLWDSEESLLEYEFSDMQSFKRELPNMMTCELHVLAVVSGGRPIPAEKVDQLKRAALKELEGMPISYAKASGKFAFMISQVQAEE